MPPHRLRRRVVGVLLVVSSAVLIAGSTVVAAAPLVAPPLPTLAAVNDMGALAQNLHVDTADGGRDGGHSTLYEGHSIWLFDDTMLADPTGFLPNTGAVTSHLDAASGITLTSATPFSETDAGTPRPVLPLTQAEVDFQNQHVTPLGGCAGSTDQYCGVTFALWPTSLVSDPANHRVLVFYGKLCRGGVDGTPCSGFLGKVIGSGVAAMQMDSGVVTRLDAAGLSAPIASVEGPDPTMFFTPDQIYGTADAVNVDDTIYAYGGCSLFQCKLARVPLASIGDVSTWTYYAGTDTSGNTTWSSSPADAVYAADAGSSGMTIQWDPGLNAYLNTYMEAFTDTGRYEVGATPYGPWSAAGTLFTGATPSGSLNDYALYAHPEFAQDNGLTQYITYYHSGPGEQVLEKVTFNPPVQPPATR